MLGNLLLLGAVTCEALFAVAAKKMQSRLPPLTTATLVTAMALAMFLPLAFWEDGAPWNAIPATAWEFIRLKE